MCFHTQTLKWSISTTEQYFCLKDNQPWEGKMELCLRRVWCPYLHIITSVENHCHGPHTSHVLDGCVGTCFDLPRFGWGQQHEFVPRMDEFAHCFPTGGRKSITSVLFWCLCQLPKQLGKDIYLQCTVGRIRWEENGLYWDKPLGPKTGRRLRLWVAKSDQEHVVQEL